MCKLFALLAGSLLVAGSASFGGGGTPLPLPFDTKDKTKPVSNPKTPADPDKIKPSGNPKTQPDPVKVPAETPSLKGVFREGEFFFQQLRVVQKSRFQIQGLPLQGSLEYGILSRLTIKKVRDDGGLEVEQQVEKVQVQADDLTRALAQAAGQKLEKSVFTIQVNASGKVTKLQGLPDTGVGPQMLAGGQGLQMISLLDQDGWKEMTEATFFVPAQPLKLGAKWVKPHTHSWGQLGAWNGQAAFIDAVTKDNLHRIDYQYQLKFEPPAGKPAAMPLGNIKFQPLLAKGSILFDAHKSRAQAVEEMAQVRGMLNVMLLGANTPVLIEEEQGFLMEILGPEAVKK
jgi:hypothetical protein